MRLTLRTLLAWKDDTLEPGQVREIGKQVKESKFAQELAERIDRVTRQRRLTVPGTTGPDATDPNIVAAYLDNDLDPDGVAEFEKRCLTSDVNLAEAASVHQILSSLGQKVKVPDEARMRMYQLVKGREAMAPRPTPAPRPPVKEPVTKPIQPWVLPSPPRRPWIERYGPALACLVLIALASVTAWKSLNMSPTPAATGSVAGPGPAGAEAKAKAAMPIDVAATGGAAPVGEVAGAMAEMVANDTTKPQADRLTGPSGEASANPEAAKADESAKARDKALAALPAGAAGLAEKSDGLLLRYNGEKREWERLLKETSLKPNDRLLCLDPFRAAIDLGKIRIAMVGLTEVRLLAPASADLPSIELLQGRLLIRQPGTSKLKVVFGKQAATVDLPPESVVGMERVALARYGQPVSQPQSLGVLCQQGEVALDAGGKQQALKPLNVALVDAGGQIQVGSRDALPSWLTQAEPTALELQVKEQFIKLFHADQPVLRDLVIAIEDERPDIRILTVQALKGLGNIDELITTLSRPNDPTARRATIAAIRDYMTQGPDASGRVRTALEEQFGDKLGGVAYHMLVGYTPDEVAKSDFYSQVVGLLSPDHEAGIIGVRELALDTLKRLTGRDDLGYDPDHPAGKGYDAWNDLLRKNELRPPAAPRNSSELRPPPAPRNPKAKTPR
jgi:hypothetical protein